MLTCRKLVKKVAAGECTCDLFWSFVVKSMIFNLKR